MKLLKKISLVLAAVMAVSVGGLAVGCAPADEGNVNNPPIEKPDDEKPDDEKPDDENPGGENPGGENPDEETPSEPGHDPETLKVAGTQDEYEPHDFEDGVCTICGTTTVFTTNQIGKTDIVQNECDEKGTIETVTYTYNSPNGTSYEKTMYVYLPAGYDPEDTQTKYDVLYMLHGMGLNEGFWFAKGTYTPEASNYQGQYGTENLLDNMMKEGMAKKAICVTPTYYLNAQSDQDNAFDKELTQVIMPLIAQKYNTYAEVTDDMTAEQVDAALKANRDHQGYIGLSLGGMYSMSYIWGSCLEYISWIGTFSGSVGGETIDELIEAKNTEYADCDINYWYVAIGATEANKNPQEYPGDPFGTYISFIQGVDGLNPGSDIANGDNCEYVTISRGGHNYANWITCLYNCLLVFFQS